MPRTIKVNTEDLFDAALRYDRLAAVMDDIAAEIESVIADLGDGPSGAVLTQAANDARRKAGGIAYELVDLSGKLRFAASRYEEYDRRTRQNRDFFVQNGN